MTISSISGNKKSSLHVITAIQAGLTDLSPRSAGCLFDSLRSYKKKQSIWSNLLLIEVIEAIWLKSWLNKVSIRRIIPFTSALRTESAPREQDEHRVSFAKLVFKFQSVCLSNCSRRGSHAIRVREFGLMFFYFSSRN